MFWNIFLAKKFYLFWGKFGESSTFPLVALVGWDFDDFANLISVLCKSFPLFPPKNIYWNEYIFKEYFGDFPHFCVWGRGEGEWVIVCRSSSDSGRGREREKELDEVERHRGQRRHASFSCPTNSLLLIETFFRHNFCSALCDSLRKPQF